MEVGQFVLTHPVLYIVPIAKYSFMWTLDCFQMKTHGVK